MARIYLYAIASVAMLALGALVFFGKRHWLGKGGGAPLPAKEERWVGGTLLFVGVLGVLTSYAVLVADQPFLFLDRVFAALRWLLEQ